MHEVITATVEDGVLKPERDIGIASGTKVRITIEPLQRDQAPRRATSDQLALTIHDLNRPMGGKPYSDRGELYDRSSTTSSVSRQQWMAELAADAEAARVGQAVSTPQEFWDETRGERF